MRVNGGAVREKDRVPAGDRGARGRARRGLTAATVRLLLTAVLAVGGTLALVRAAPLEPGDPAVAATAPAARAGTQPIPADTPPVPADSTASTAPAATPTSSPATGPTGGPGPAVDSLDGQAPDTVIQQILAAGSPPNLPPATSAAVIALAEAYLTADLTGVGRARFPSLGATATSTLPGFAVQAAIARRQDGRADVADVTVIYTDTDPNDPEQQHRTVITVALDGTTWVLALPGSAPTTANQD